MVGCMVEACVKAQPCTQPCAVLGIYQAIVGPTLRPHSSFGPILGRMVGCMVGACVSKPNHALNHVLSWGNFEAIFGHCRPDSATFFIFWPHLRVHGWAHVWATYTPPILRLYFFIGLAARVRSVGMRQPCVEVYFVVAPETHATFFRPIK